MPPKEGYYAPSSLGRRLSRAQSKVYAFLGNYPVSGYLGVVEREEFLEALLKIMEQKTHWAWPAFTSGQVKKAKLHIHLEQEYETYVRDFPVLVAWAYVQCPIAAVRRELAENIYEEETGGIAAGRPHPELFLEYPKGLGMDLARFENIQLLDGAKIYRDFLDDACQNQGWAVAVAVSTIFIEGTKYERGEVDENAAKRPAPPLTDHPLVKHYGLPVEHLALTKAHRSIEGEHRQSAWDIILDHVPNDQREPVLKAMALAQKKWRVYRDAVAAACGISKP
jgi:pyrroloquinoline quinone (PQQ) biosynthesis protein C